MKKNVKVNGCLYYRNFGEHPPILRLQIGDNLIHLMDETNRGTPLVAELQKCRNYFDEEYGLTIPNIRISENKALEPDEYFFEMNGVEVGRGNLKSEGREDKAQEIIIKEYVQILIRKNITRILNQNLVAEHINKVLTINPEVADDVLFTNHYPLRNIEIILNALLEENVPIRNMSSILEAIAQYIHITRNDFDILEKVREKLSLEILSRCSDKEKVVHGIIIAEDVTELIRKNLISPPDGSSPQIPLETIERRKLMKTITEQAEAFGKKGFHPLVFVCPSILRRALFSFLDRTFDDYFCISDMEFIEAGKNFICKKEGEITFEEK